MKESRQIKNVCNKMHFNAKPTQTGSNARQNISYILLRDPSLRCRVPRNQIIINWPSILLNQVQLKKNAILLLSSFVTIWQKNGKIWRRSGRLQHPNIQKERRTLFSRIYDNLF